MLQSNTLSQRARGGPDPRRIPPYVTLIVHGHKFGRELGLSYFLTYFFVTQLNCLFQENEYSVLKGEF